MENTTRSQMQDSVDAWKALVDRQVKLATSMTEQVAKMQVKGVEQAVSAADQLQRFAVDSASRVHQVTDAQKNLDAWKKLAEDQMIGAAAACDMFNDFRGDGVEQARAMVGDLSEMSKATFSFASEMSEQWRKLTLETARRATETVFSKP